MIRTGRVTWKDAVATDLLYKAKLKQADETHTFVTVRTRRGEKIEAIFFPSFPLNRQNFRSEVSHSTICLCTVPSYLTLLKWPLFF